jgi:hypothetical protein
MLVRRAAIATAGMLSLSACGMFGGKEIDVAAEEPPSAAELRVAELEHEVRRLKDENAALSEKLSELMKAAALTADEAAEEEPPELKEPTVALAQPPTPELKPETVVAAADAGRALADAQTKPVEPSPRLVQPTFASQQETVFENEAQGIELASVLFGVHLASYRQADEASAGWAKLQRDFPDELGLLEPRLEPVAIEGRGEFLRLIGGGFSTEEKALSLCATLKSKGVYCAVTGFNGRKLALGERDAG